MPLFAIGTGLLLIFLVISGKLQQVLAQVLQTQPPKVTAGT